MYLVENPAARLYEILLEARELSKDNPAGSKFKATWSKVFSIDETDLDGIIQGILGVRYLCNQTRSLIYDHEKLNNERNLSYLDNIYNSLYTLNLQGNMSAFNQYLTQETLIALSYMSDSIELVYNLNKTIIEEEEKVELLQKIDDLVSDFIDSDLPEDLMSVCTNSLANIKNALVHYKIYGAKGLEESTSKAIGDVFIKTDTIAENHKNENMNKFFNIVQRIKLLLTTSESAIKIATMTEPMFSLLLKK